MTVGGEIQLDATETVWCFKPRETWRPGEYSLQIDARLEDLAGNNLRGSFEREANDNYSDTLSVLSRDVHCQLSVRTYHRSER